MPQKTHVARTKSFRHSGAARSAEPGIQLFARLRQKPDSGSRLRRVRNDEQSGSPARRFLRIEDTNMTLHPILAALKKHKAGVILITLQIALTLAIVCNAVFIISQLWVNAPTGNDQASIDKLDAMQRADVEILRQLPDVESAVAINSLPLSGNNWSGGIRLKPDQKTSTAHASFYFGGWQMVHVLGLQLIAGRDFTATDQRHRGFREKTVPP